MKYKKLIKYATAALIALAVGVAVFFSRPLENYNDTNEVIKYLADAFFVPAMLYIGFGLLMFAVNEGTLDILGYGFKSLLYLFTPIKKKEAGGYYEYRMKKKEERKPTPYYIIFVGLAFLAVSIVFTLLYKDI